MKKSTFLWVFMCCMVGTLFAQTPAELSEIQAAKADQQMSVNLQELMTRLDNVGDTSMPLTNFFTANELQVLRSYSRPQSANRLADIIPTAGATESFSPVVGDFIYDPSDGVNGGPGGDCSTTSSGDLGDYPNCDCITVTTFNAPPGEEISVTFNSFRVFGAFDWFAIFDGSGPVTATNGSGSATNPTSGDPELWNSSVDGDELVDMINAGMTTFTSTSGSLTFASRFSGVVNTCGWEAEVVPAGGGGGGGITTPTVFGYEAVSEMYGSFDPVAPEVFTAISMGAADGTSLELTGDVDPNNPTTAYVSTTTPNFYSMDIETGVYTLIGPQALTFIGTSFDPTSGILYGYASDANLYTIDLATGAGTLVGPTGNTGLADLAITGDGDAYGHDLAADQIVSIDLTTGTATPIGPTGFNANFAQGMTWDPNSDTVFLASFNAANFLAEWRSVDLTTGATTIVGNINDPNVSEVTWAGIPFVPPMNDDCSGAVAMDCGDVETGDTNDFSDTGGFNASPDAWYSYTGSGDPEFITFSLCDGGTTYDSRLTVFDSCGGAQVVSNDDSCGLQSEVSFLSDGTTTYYVAVEGFGTTSAGPYSLELSCNPVAANDLCDDAIEIACGDVVAGSTNFATIDTAAGSCAGQDITAAGVWYTYTESIPGFIQDINLSTCDDADYDTKISVYSGDCGTLTCVAANDDGNGCSGFTSSVDFQSDGVSTYYILVHGFGTATGNFNLTMTCSPVPPPNDMIVNSIDVDEIGFPYTDPAVNMPGATTEAGTPADCDNAGVQGVWYNFVPEMGGEATATVTSPAGYTSVTFYTADTEDSVETDLTLVDYFDNQCVPGADASILVTAGQVYYVYVANTMGVTDIVIDGDFYLGTGDTEIAGFNYYPNPATDQLNLSSGTGTIESAIIYNILGQEVVSREIGSNNAQLDVANLSVGTYILKVVVDGELGIYKIVKQ